MTTDTTPKSRPILFSGPMIRALLDGTKTQTRRTVKPQPHAPTAEYGDVEESEKYPGEFFQWCGGEPDPSFTCPHGVVGDLLWVREAWSLVRFYPAYEHGAPTGTYEDLSEWTGPLPGQKPPGHDVVYRADCWWDDHKDDRGFNWRPSIFLPRWASRITLRITDIRVERLGSIGHADIAAEGVLDEFDPEFHQTPYRYGRDKERYARLWDAINGPGAWEQDPYVWVISFSRITP